MPASAILAVATTAFVHDRQKKQAAEVEERQEELTKKEQAVQASQAARQRRKQVAQALVAQSAIENVDVQTAGAGSSASVAGQTSAARQYGANVQEVNQAVRDQNALSLGRQRVVNAQNKVDLASTIFSNVAAGAASSAGQQAGAGIADMFKTKPKNTTTG